MTEKPRILLFTGDGKGKTTAALGMALRATGHGMKVFVLQFIKQDDTTGEIAAIRSIDNIEIEQTGKGFVPSPGNARFADHREAAEAGLARATDVILSGDYDLVVLDEICITVSRALIAEQDVLDLLPACPTERGSR